MGWGSTAPAPLPWTPSCALCSDAMWLYASLPRVYFAARVHAQLHDAGRGWRGLGAWLRVCRAPFPLGCFACAVVPFWRSVVVCLLPRDEGQLACVQSEQGCTLRRADAFPPPPFVSTRAVGTLLLPCLPALAGRSVREPVEPAAGCVAGCAGLHVTRCEGRQGRHGAGARPGTACGRWAGRRRWRQRQRR